MILRYCFGSFNVEENLKKEHRKKIGKVFSYKDGENGFRPNTGKCGNFCKLSLFLKFVAVKF